MASGERRDAAAFDEEKRHHIAALGRDADLRARSVDWIAGVSRHRYSYHFTWMGLPIIQFPQDIVAMQELIWRIRPDLIVETGIARGGSLVFYASMLELLGAGEVLGIDIDIRAENRAAIEAHAMAPRIRMIEGSSTDAAVVRQVRAAAADKERVLVVLDANHTHAHVLAELELYSPLVRPGSYVVVFDTIVEDLPPDFFPDRPWGPGDNPATAVRDFLAGNDRFVADAELDAKLLISVAPGGYLRCVKP